MLLYESNRFRKDGISFRIPEGYYMVSIEEHSRSEFLKLISSDFAYNVVISVCFEGKSSKDELNTLFSELHPEIIDSYETVAMNGLDGLHVTYKKQDGQYAKVWIDIDDRTTFILTVHTEFDISDFDILRLLGQIDPMVTIFDDD